VFFIYPHTPLTIVLASDPVRRLVYELYYIFTGGEGQYIRFEKDNKSNRNPAIVYWLFERGYGGVTNVTVEINSVDLIKSPDLLEVKTKKEYTNVKIRLYITDALITDNGLTEHFVYITNVDYVEIIIKNCKFELTNLLPASVLRVWIKLHSSNNSPMKIQIENTSISGKPFLEMVGGVAQFKNCTFKDAQVARSVSLLAFRNSTVTMESCRFFNILLGDYMTSQEKLMRLHFKRKFLRNLPRYNNEQLTAMRLHEIDDERAQSVFKRNAFVFTSNNCHVTLNNNEFRDMDRMSVLNFVISNIRIKTLSIRMSSFRIGMFNIYSLVEITNLLVDDSICTSILKGTPVTSSGSITINNTVIRNNRISDSIFSYPSVILTMRNFTVTNNYIKHYVIVVINCMLRLHEAVVKGNELLGFLYGWKGNDVHVEKAKVVNNTGKEIGKFVHLSDSSLTLYNVLSWFEKNSAKYPEYPVIFLSGIDLEARNVTFEVANMPYTKSITVALMTLNVEKTIYNPGITVKCPVNYNANAKIMKKMLLYKVSCTSCHRGSRSNERGYGELIHEKLEVLRDEDFFHRSKNATCSPCPAGATCNGNIRSRGNFYGFLMRDGTLNFLPCPDRYCCSEETNHCKTITTCNENRQGRLCGRCKNGTYINFFNNNCIPERRCGTTEKRAFWLFFLSTPIFLSLVLTFAKDLKENIKMVFSKFKWVIHILLLSKQKTRRTESLNIDADTTTFESEDLFSGFILSNQIPRSDTTFVINNHHN